MDIKEKIRNDIRRLFHGADPMRFAEDARVVELPCSTYLQVDLRVPTPTEAAYEMYCNGHFWPYPAPPAPKKEPAKKDPMELVDFLKPTRIIYSGPKTIVFWPDGTKTIVSLMEGQEHDDYTAYCAAVVKKMFGATHKAKKFIESVAVRPEPKPKKVEEKAPAVEAEEADVPVKPWEQVSTMLMPGTEDPDWGRKHWCPDAPVLAEEVSEDDV